MNYSPGGVLGLVWRTNTQAAFPALSPYSIWAALSFDDGATFSAPAMASQGSPAALPGALSGGNLFQDLSAIALDDLTQRVYVGWGGWNTGERNVAGLLQGKSADDLTGASRALRIGFHRDTAQPSREPNVSFPDAIQSPLQFWFLGHPPDVIVGLPPQAGV